MFDIYSLYIYVYIYMYNINIYIYMYIYIYIYIVFIVVIRDAMFPRGGDLDRPNGCPQAGASPLSRLLNPPISPLGIFFYFYI